MKQKKHTVQNASPSSTSVVTNSAATSQDAGSYAAKQRETLAEAPGLRVRLLVLLEGQIVPWHLHNHITDTFFCMRGPMRVLTRAPDAAYNLNAGDSLAVLPGTPHRVECGDAAECRFMIVQGVGEYDYLPIAD